ncbi:MAG: chaperone modulator CbpM [Frankia sp.]
MIYAVARLESARPDGPRLERLAADRLDLAAFATASGLHPQLARRFVALGLLEAATDEAGRLWFAASQVAAAARIQRLRAGLGVNYVAVGVIVDLLDRIATLESALRHTPGASGGPSWTRTA